MNLKILLGISFVILNTLFAQQETKQISLSTRNSTSNNLAEKAYIRHRDFSLTYWMDKLTVSKPSFMMASNYFSAVISSKSLDIEALQWHGGDITINPAMN